jgi:hypothetical protein
MDLSDCSESLLFGEFRGASLQAKTLAPDADGPAGNENDIIACVFEIADSFNDTG